MRKAWLRLVVVLGMVGLVAGFTGCNAKPAVELTGKWAEVDGVDTVEFKADGTFSANLVYDSQAVQKPVVGKYTSSGAKVVLTAPDAKDSMVWTVAMEGGVLKVTYTQGGAEKLDGSGARYKKAG